MKKVLLYLLLIFICPLSYGQLQGSFKYAQDGHIYFYLSNPTGYQVPVVWGVYNLNKNEQRQYQGCMAPYSTFTYGLNANWLWEKGERFAITYANGQTVYWTCPETDPALRNRNQPSFKRGYHLEDKNKKCYNRSTHFEVVKSDYRIVLSDRCINCGAQYRNH